MPADKAALAAGLKLARTVRMHFAFICLGAEGRLLVEKKKISNKQIAESRKELGGGIIVRGMCQFQEGTLIFEVPKEQPGTIANAVKKNIKADAGMVVAVEFRVNAELQDETETEGATPPAPVAPPDQTPSVNAPAVRSPNVQAPVVQPPPNPPSPSPTVAPKVDSAAALKRLNALAGPIKKALSGPNGAPVQKLFSDAGQRLKTGDIRGAEESISQLEALLAAPNPTPTATPTAPPSTDGGALIRRLNGLTASIKSALAGPNAARVQQLFAGAAKLLKSGDFATASTTLDELESLLVTVPPGDEISLVKLGKSRIEWNAARQHAVSEVQRLLSLLQAEFAGDPDNQTQLANALSQLNEVIQSLDEKLGNELDLVLNAQGTQRPQLALAAKQTVNRLINYLDSDELISELDGNELAPDMLFVAPMQTRLQEIAASLG